MKKNLFLLLFALLSFSGFSQEWGSNDKRIDFPFVEIQCLNSQELGFGASYISGRFLNTFGVNMSNLFNLRYKTGDFLYCNKIQVQRSFMFLTAGVSCNNYVDFKGYAFTIAPEVGWGVDPLLRICYSYNFECIRNSLNKTNVHCISLQYWITYSDSEHRISRIRYY